MRYLSTLFVFLVLVSFGRSDEYSITDLGLVGDKPFRPYAMNNFGQIVGAIDGPGSDLELGYYWQNGQLFPIGTLGEPLSTPNDINASGEIVGASLTALGFLHPFYFSCSTGLVDLMAAWPEEEGTARAINDAGQVLVSRADQIWLTDKTGSTWELVPSLPGADSNNAVALASNKATLGRSWLGDKQRSFWSLDGNVLDLGLVPGYDSTSALDCNEDGQVTGLVTGATQTHRSFLWEGGQISLVDDLGGGWSVASGINNSQMIIGTAHSPVTNDSRAFCYQNGEALSLDDLTNNESWQLHGAEDCDDSGQIVGSGLLEGQWRGYLATPVPEPSALLGLVGLCAGLVARRRRK